MAHTPGPWHWVEPDTECDGAFLAGDDGNACVLDFGSDAEPNEADARLIAAAPELLAALQRAREELAWFANEHQCCRLKDGVMYDIDNALKKATQP